MPPFTIRTYGDPVLRQRASEVTDIDGSVRQIVDGMIDTLYDASGLAVAAPQVGIEKRLFVYDLNDEKGPRTIINPTVVESGGEWTFNEGCLSIPGLYFTVVRPRDILLQGWDLDGNEVRIHATDLEGRMFQHEIEHLDGHLVLERLEAVQRKAALRVLRDRQTPDGRFRRGDPVTIDLDGRVVDD